MNDSSPAQQLLILVVDDSATSRVVIAKQLKKLGCDVVTAKDGTSGLAEMAQQEFDLVLLDCQMPDMSGYEVAEQVRKREREEERAYTPIIAISAETDAAHAQHCINSGMDGVLGKPLPEEDLKQILSLWCDADVSSAPAATMEEMKSVDLRALFRSTSIEDMTALQSSIAQGDLLTVARLAHRMKGAALTIGVDGIVATLVRIEAIAAGKIAVGTLSAEMDMLQRQLQAI